jgi:hypothetical protein
MILEWMLGTAGIAIVNWLLDNVAIVSVVLAGYLSVYFAGRLQMRHIVKRTETLVLEAAMEMTRKGKRINRSGLYKRLYPEWTESLRSWAWFIPHRLELLIVPVSVEAVLVKLPFSPEWIDKVLEKNQLRG